MAMKRFTYGMVRDARGGVFVCWTFRLLNRWSFTFTCYRA